MIHRSVLVIAAVVSLVSLAVSRPAVHATQTQDGGVVATFRGDYTGSSIPLALGPFPLRAGVVIVRGRHNGTANFAVNLRLPDAGTGPEEFSVDTYLVVDGLGRYDGAGAAVIRASGDYFLLLAAGGAYELTVEQPAPANAAVTDERSFTGLGQQVSAPLRLTAGTVTIAAQTDQQFLTVWLYAIDDLGGGAAGPGYDGRVIDTTRETGLVVSVDLPKAGLYFLRTATGVTNERWQVQVQQ